MAEEEKTDEMTAREFRLAMITELKEEGFSEEGIAQELWLDAKSVRGIWQRHRDEIEDQPPWYRSSLAASFENHKPNEHQIKNIEKIRKAADDLCLEIDRFAPHSREASLAKTHLEETVMWAVKSIVLPRENVEVRRADGF